MRNRISLLLLSILISGIYSVKCQPTFSLRMEDTIYDHQARDAVELLSGNFIIIDQKFISSGSNSSGTTLSSRLSKISSNGKIIEQKEFNYQSTSSGFSSVNLLNNNFLVLSGFVQSPPSNQLWMCIMDTSMNIIKNKIFLFSGYSLMRSGIKVSAKNEILCFGWICDTTVYHHSYGFIYKFSANLDSTQLRVYNDKWSIPMDFLIRNDQDGYYLVCLGYGDTATSNIISIDASLNVRRIIGMPNDDNMNTIIYRDSNHLFVTGEYSYLWPSTDKRDLGVLVYDTVFRLLHSSAFGKKDTEDFPAFHKNIDFTKVNSIFYGGTSNLSSDEFSPQDSWYLLNNIDTTLNLNWQKYYGGDGYYTMYGLLATRDNGCLMFGTIWDYHNTQKYIRYISLIKVNKDGLFLSITDPPLQQPREAIIYPNPGNDFIFVKTQLKDSRISFFNITGNEILQQELNPGNNILSVSQLPSGIYIYRLTQIGSIKEYGKWIKD